MGLDIYAGTLTRYYSHNWKTVVQQWAEENGYTFNRITPDGEPADDVDQANQRFAVEANFTAGQPEAVELAEAGGHVPKQRFRNELQFIAL